MPCRRGVVRAVVGKAAVAAEAVSVAAVLKCLIGSKLIVAGGHWRATVASACEKRMSHIVTYGAADVCAVVVVRGQAVWQNVVISDIDVNRSRGECKERVYHLCCNREGRKGCIS
jgi:hypothetical protein